MNEEWTQEQSERGLEELLEADSAEKFRGSCDKIAIRDGRDLKNDSVRRWYWGLFNGLVELNRGSTTLRTGPKTYGEVQFIKWASNNNTKDKRKVINHTPETVARMIRRPVEFVERIWTEVGPAQGRASFGLFADRQRDPARHALSNTERT